MFSIWYKSFNRQLVKKFQQPLSREPQMKKTKVRPDYSSAPTQLALCLRFASMYKAESCYALQPSMTRLHNAGLVN
jgi:hypothetical protein